MRSQARLCRDWRAASPLPPRGQARAQGATPNFCPSAFGPIVCSGTYPACRPRYYHETTEVRSQESEVRIDFRIQPQGYTLRKVKANTLRFIILTSDSWLLTSRY